MRNFCPGFHRAISALLYFALFLFLGFVLPCCIRCGEKEKNTKKLQIFHCTRSLQERCFFSFSFFKALTAYLFSSSTYRQRWYSHLPKKTNTISGTETKWGYPVSLKRVRIWPCISALSPLTVSKATYISRMSVTLKAEWGPKTNKIYYLRDTVHKWLSKFCFFPPCLIAIILSTAKKFLFRFHF